MSHEIEPRNLKVVQSLFAATGSGDWPAAEALLTEDFFVTEAPSNVFAGVYRGRKSLQTLFTHVVAAAGVTNMEVKQFCTGGDLVVAMVEMTLAGPPPTVVSLAEVFKVRDGKVCEIKPHYFDAEPLGKAVAAKKARA